MITIKDIAKLANVSPGTVDRVIHDREGVSLKTKTKVEQIMKEQNFKINTVARSLALRKKYEIAILIPDSDQDNRFWRSPYLGSFKGGEEVAHLGINLQHFFFSQLDKKSYAEQCEEIVKSAPDAVIFSPYFKDETHLFVNQLEESNIPYLFLNINIEGCNNLAFLGQDAYQSGFVSGKLFHLCAGKENVCLIPQIESKMYNNNVLEQRLHGFTDYFKSNNLPFRLKSLKIDDLDHFDLVKESIQNAVKEIDVIDGIWVPSSRISVVANCLTEQQLKKLTLIGFDSTEQNVTCLQEDKVTFLISQKSFNQGYMSVKILADYLIQKIIPLKNILSPIEIITKENLAFSQRNKKAYLIK